MKKYTFKKLMAYIYMPLIFAILGYGIVYLAARPILEVGGSMISLVLSTSGPEKSQTPSKSFMEPDSEASKQSAAKNTAAPGKSQQSAINVKDITYPQYGDLYGKLTCDRIGLAADVYYGDDSQLLRKGAGQYIGSGLPGFGRQILLAGHNVTTFAPLKDMKAGDVVTFKTAYGTYEYKITDMKVLDARDTSAYDLLADGEKLVMYTCYPFTMLGSTNERYFVYGDKILGPQIAEGGR